MFTLISLVVMVLVRRVLGDRERRLRRGRRHARALECHVFDVDADATAAKAAELGGSVLVAPMEAPYLPADRAPRPARRHVLGDGVRAREQGRWPRGCLNDPTAQPGSVVSAQDVDEYLQGIQEPKRSTLESLRRTILEVVPDAEQVISYQVPAFRVEGKTIAGFAAFRNHLSYLPFSGSVLRRFAEELCRLHDGEESTALPRRPSAAEDACEEADCGSHHRGPRLTLTRALRSAETGAAP